MLSFNKKFTFFLLFYSKFESTVVLVEGEYANLFECLQFRFAA